MKIPLEIKSVDQILVAFALQNRGRHRRTTGKKNEPRFHEKTRSAAADTLLYIKKYILIKQEIKTTCNVNLNE